MRTKRVFATLAILLTLFGAAAFAQVRGALIVQSSVSGAQVYADDRLIGNATPNFTILLPARTYTIKVVKAGFKDFVQSVNLTSAGVTVQANLVPINAVAPPPPPAQYALTVNSNVSGAEVYLNGNRAGNTPLSIQVAPGTYTVQVKAAGYNGYNQTFNVTGPTQVNATLATVQVTLTVNSNVAGASVYLNGNLSGNTPLNLQVIAGSYTVMVRAPGYNDYSQNVAVGGNTQVSAVLSPVQFTLTVGANVQGANVFINGNQAGKTPFSTNVGAGNYTVLVMAAGYSDFSQTLSVNGNSQVNAILVASTFPVTIDSGSLRGAQVFLNGAMVGQTPYSTNLAIGNYSVVIKAPGYADYSAQLGVRGPQSLSASLVPLMASWNLSIPDGMVNKALKEGPWAQFQLWIDGNLQQSTSGQLPAGKHALRIVTGSLATETSLDFLAGKAYSFEPFIGLTVK